MITTRGGPKKCRSFSWWLDKSCQELVIKNEFGRVLTYSLVEVQNVLEQIEAWFAGDPFPLGNNVALLGNGTERMGLGTAILAHTDGDVTKAQGASYLGVVLEEIGYFRWNGKNYGIEWQLLRKDFSVDEIRNRLSN
jgi:hypothetical protein